MGAVVFATGIITQKFINDPDIPKGTNVNTHSGYDSSKANIPISTNSPLIDNAPKSINEQVDLILGISYNYFQEPYNKIKQDSILEKINFLYKIPGLSKAENEKLKFFQKN